jgi:hypothetical protein
VARATRTLLTDADRRVLPAITAAVSVDPDRVRQWLRLGARAFVDPERPERPDEAAVLATARFVVAQSQQRMALASGTLGLGGLATIPPEALATGVSSLRLAQRLAVVFGLDPRTDRGRVAVWMALAAAYEVDLPDQGPLGPRVSELPGALIGRIDPKDTALGVGAAVLRGSALRLLANATRWFPLPAVSLGLSLRGAARRHLLAGERMIEAIRGVADAPDHPGWVDAVEVR